MKRARFLLLAWLLLATPAAAASGHLEGTVPAAAHVPGEQGSFWTTDLWVYQQGASVIHLWFNPSGQDGTTAESVVVPLDTVVTSLPDVVATVFGRDQGLGSIHYLADGPVVVESRTWTTSPGGGSYGQTIPGIPLAASLPAGGDPGLALRMVVDQTPGFRSNLGLVNVTPLEVSVAVGLFTADGNAAPGASTFTVDLPPFSMRQVNDVLTRLEPGSRAGLVVRASVASDEGAIVAYVSTVDNATNDPSYQEAFRFAY